MVERGEPGHCCHGRAKVPGSGARAEEGAWRRGGVMVQDQQPWFFCKELPRKKGEGEGRVEARRIGVILCYI